MKNFIYYNDLFSIYSPLLTDNEKNSFKEHYFEDLSLSEIAEEKNISRAAVHKTVNNVIDKLNYYESILHIYENKSALKECLDINDLDLIKSKINELLEK